MKQVAGRLKLEYAQYRELAAFAQFGSDLDAVTRRTLDRGARITEVFKQPQYQPLALSQEASILFAVTNGFLDDVHPLLQRRPVRNSALILVTPDRGLTGALVGNLIRAGAAYVAEREPRPSVIAVGRKGRDWMIRHGANLLAEFTGLDRPSLSDVSPIARIVTDEFAAGRIDEVALVYARFYSTSNQRPVRVPLLPVEPTEPGPESQRYANFLFEPSPEEVLAAILPRYVTVQIYQAILESLASEHGARMIAMHNATENAKDIVRSLTLTYNKARQAGITKEILEISGGAEALREAG
jgi:F-type H+-transporting ATPase subunit gamma